MNTVSLSIFLATFVYLRYYTNNKSGTTVCSKGEGGCVKKLGLRIKTKEKEQGCDRREDDGVCSRTKQFVLID